MVGSEAGRSPRPGLRFGAAREVGTSDEGTPGSVSNSDAPPGAAPRPACRTGALAEAEAHEVYEISCDDEDEPAADKPEVWDISDSDVEADEPRRRPSRDVPNDTAERVTSPANSGGPASSRDMSKGEASPINSEPQSSSHDTSGATSKGGASDADSPRQRSVVPDTSGNTSERRASPVNRKRTSGERDASGDLAEGLSSHVNSKAESSLQAMSGDTSDKGPRQVMANQPSWRPRRRVLSGNGRNVMNRIGLSWAIPARQGPPRSAAGPTLLGRLDPVLNQLAAAQTFDSMDFLRSRPVALRTRRQGSYDRPVGAVGAGNHSTASGSPTAGGGESPSGESDGADPLSRMSPRLLRAIAGAASLATPRREMVVLYLMTCISLIYVVF